MLRRRENGIHKCAMLGALRLFMVWLVLAGCGAPPDAVPGAKECAAGELTRVDGTCQPAGVPPSACGVGFVPDGKGGCEPILPAATCPVGRIAVPGDTVCREIAPCGTGTWGDIPIEANTQLVNQAYTGGNSDGTQERPWTTIQQAVDNAADGAIVAVAAGSYLEDVSISSNAVRLWGRCPRMVKIKGTSAAIEVRGQAANGTEIHGIAVTEAYFGIMVKSALDVLIDRVWIHGADESGLYVSYESGPAGVTVRGSLIEENLRKGVVVSGADVTMEATVVRSTLPSPSLFSFGEGIVAYGSMPYPGSLTIRGCLLEQNHEVGVLVSGAAATIEATVVRSPLPSPGTGLGHGINIEDSANVTVRACLIEQNRGAGVLVVGSNATIEATVVRATQADLEGYDGFGIHTRPSYGSEVPSNVTVRACLIEQNRSAGVHVSSSDATIEATIIRGTLPRAPGVGGHGIDADRNVKNGGANMTIRGCLVEQNHGCGVLVAESDATIETTVVRDTLPSSLWQAGVVIAGGASAHAVASAVIRRCLFERNPASGVRIWYSDVTIVDSTVRDTLPRWGDNKFGDGIDVFKGNATIQNVEVTRNARAGVAVFGGHAVITGGAITCNGFDLSGEPYDGIPFSYNGSTGWQCSAHRPAACTELGTCHVDDVCLEPPPNVPPLAPATP